MCIGVRAKGAKGGKQTQSGYVKPAHKIRAFLGLWVEEEHGAGHVSVRDGRVFLVCVGC